MITKDDIHAIIAANQVGRGFRSKDDFQRFQVIIRICGIRRPKDGQKNTQIHIELGITINVIVTTLTLNCVGSRSTPQVAAPRKTLKTSRGQTGRTFFIEEVNGDDVWRYRSGIQVYASERPVEVWVDDDWDGCSSGAMLDGHTCGLDAFYSIQTALNSVASPGKVNVAPGFYSENINFNGKAITLRSASCSRIASTSVGTPA